jgi:hypothetical protein
MTQENHEGNEMDISRMVCLPMTAALHLELNQEQSRALPMSPYRRTHCTFWLNYFCDTRLHPASPPKGLPHS